MVFEGLPAATLNPVRDVWFPLNLSNAASFNAIMAHSAAHMARMRGSTGSNEALQFKMEAIRIVKLWMEDPKLALCDDTITAVMRLLTYEVGAPLAAHHLCGADRDTRVPAILGDRVRMASA